MSDYLGLSIVQDRPFVLVKRRYESGESVPTSDGLDQLTEVKRPNGKVRRVVSAVRHAPQLAHELATRNDAAIRRFLGKDAAPWEPLSPRARMELLGLLQEFPGLEVTARHLNDPPVTLASAITRVLATTTEARST